MVEKALHAGNVSACVAAVVAAADISISGGATLAFSGALSTLEVFKGLSRSQQAVAQKMAKRLDTYLTKTHLSGDRKKIVVQLVSDYPPSETDILGNSEDAKKIARAMAERVHESATDPSQKSSQALEDYKMALVALLTPALAPKDRNEARDQEILRTSHATQDMVQDLRETLTEEIRAQQEDQFKRLVEELKRQSNLPFDVERERSAAKAAIEKKRYDDARNNLERAAEITHNSADQANLDYARSLAALGALAFTVSDFADARLQYSKTLNIPGLEEERRANYQRSYLIASNAVIARQSIYAEGRKVLDEMVADGVTPNEVTYSTLINLAPSYAEGRKVLDEMVADGVTPDEVTYNTLINLAPSYAEGRKVLDEMVADGVTPDEVTYNTLINLAPSYAEGRKVLDEMVADGVTPNEVTYNTLINLAPSYAEGRKVLDEMVADGVTPNEVTYNTLINLAPSYAEGRKVLDEMVADGVTPNEVTYNTLINLAPSYAEGRKVLDEMVADGVTPDEVTYSTLINLAPSYAEGRKVLDEMVADGVTPDEVTYSTLINLAPSYAEGRKVLDEMVADGVTPDEVTYNTLINLAPSYAEGRKVLDEMVADGVTPNEVTYSTLINLAPSYAEGRKVLDEMVADGVTPNEVTLITLLNIGATFHQGCDLAHYARDPHREWFTGRGFYTALFARHIDHLSADELLSAYSDMPFQFDIALENPIRQYRRTRQQEQALSLAMRFPYLPASAKFFRERMDFCLPEFAARVSAGESEEDLHYAYGIAAQLAKVWDLAHEQLSIALEMATAEARHADIERRLLAIAERCRD